MTPLNDCHGATAITQTKLDARTGSLARIVPTDAIPGLAASDRALLRDLAVVQVISRDLTEQFHYARGGASRALARLEDAGILRAKPLYVAGERPMPVYRFATRAIAASWGDPVLPAGGHARMLHEILTARAYFALRRPLGFRIAAHLSEAEISLFESHRPDAVYVDTASGELVLVEADSGQYTPRQIREKLAYWRFSGFLRQVWVQPACIHAVPVPEVPGIRILRL